MLYGSASELRTTLDCDFSEERKFSYKNLSMGEIVHHLAVFVSRLWQIHVFGEGNARTTAVFFIKYLHTLGFHAINDIFAENAWYFRNSLVRANYNDLKTASHILKLREAFPEQTIFGQSDVMKAIDMKASRASDLLREMAVHGIIEPVAGHGKGKYRFRQ